MRKEDHKKEPRFYYLVDYPLTVYLWALINIMNVLTGIISNNLLTNLFTSDLLTNTIFFTGFILSLLIILGIITKHRFGFYATTIIIGMMLIHTTYDAISIKEDYFGKISSIVSIPILIGLLIILYAYTYKFLKSPIKLKKLWENIHI